MRRFLLRSCLLAVALSASGCADGVPVLSDAMKPRTAADVIAEHAGDDVTFGMVSTIGTGHHWYERVADGTATVTFERDGELCVGVGRIRDGEEWADLQCVAPIEDLEAPQRVDLELETVEVWQVPDDAASVTVLDPDLEYETRPQQLAGGSWIIRPFGTAITDIVVNGD